MKNCVCDLEKYDELNQSFRIIAFDWDGTAIISRKEDISELIIALKKLLKQGIYLAVITGTNFENIDKQFSSHITGFCKKNLFICTNRGSEVFGFYENFQPVLLYRLNISDEENRLLDKTAEKTKFDLESNSSVKINIIYDRLNRRKLDLIPEWENPLKSEIGKLIIETDKRLKTGGFKEGIKGAFDLAENNAWLLGLNKAKVTSDVKHIEVGMSDKSDSMKWILEHIAVPNKIPDKEILVLGDEFGPVAGFDGSDYKMVLKNHKEIKYFSVGKEPNGLPPEVKHLNGGPACFLKLMQKIY